MLLAGAVGLAAWEAAWWLRRRANRTATYRRAAARAKQLGRPLVVVGAPDGGVTAGYGCGDMTLDLGPSTCPQSYRVDVTKPLAWPDGCCVIFCSCVLEYVADIDAALKELRRVSGGELYVVSVEPWTATAFLYPGAKRRMGHGW